MPDDPNRNLEEQLTAWARKRREEAGAPFELHPATRKMLQDEVARTFPKKSDEPAAESAGWWKMFWPRFALAGSLCLAMVILAGILLPGIARSKSKAQQIALVRQQEKALSADLGPRDAPAQIAPNTSSSRAAEAPVRQRGDEAGKASVPESQPTAAPSLAESKLLKQEVLVQAEPKDAQLKVEQPAKVEERQFSEKSRQLVLSDKAKEAPSPAGAGAPARALNVENERSQVLLRQRYGLAPAQAGGVTSATNALADELKIPVASRTSPAAAPLVALDGANVGQGVGSVGGRGFAGGTATNPAPGANLVLNSPVNRAKADDRSLALARSRRVATGNVDSPAQQRETDRLGTGNVDSYYAAIPPTSAPQRFAQVREYRVNLNSPPMPNVLSSFQLVQNGRQIRVVDADGSIYDGAIEQSPTEEAARRDVAIQTAGTELKKNVEPETKRVEGVSAAAAGEIAASQNVFFRVAGTNRTLNQLVVFEGNFLARKDQANELVAGAKSKTNQSPAAGQNLSKNGQRVPSALIQGQAMIGTSNRIEINAAPVSE
jgi:hypothetical protein